MSEKIWFFIVFIAYIILATISIKDLGALIACDFKIEATFDGYSNVYNKYSKETYCRYSYSFDEKDYEQIKTVHKTFLRDILKDKEKGDSQIIYVNSKNPEQIRDISLLSLCFTNFYFMIKWITIISLTIFYIIFVKNKLSLILKRKKNIV